MGQQSGGLFAALSKVTVLGVRQGVANPSHDGISSIVAYHKWLESVGVSPTTGWRWERDGRIHTTNIAGRKYVTRGELDEFQRRAEAGEFAHAPAGAAANALGRRKRRRFPVPKNNKSA